MDVTSVTIVYDEAFSTAHRFSLMKRIASADNGRNRAQNKKGHFVRNDPLMPKTGKKKWRPLGDSNPCYRRERAVS